MITYPGLPGPEITPHLTREASRSHYSPGTEFLVGRISLVGNTGTYLDSPYHRYPGGADLAGIPLDRTTDLPAVVVRVTGAQRRGIDVGALVALDVRGAAVLLHTGDDEHWFGTPGYAEGRALSHGGRGRLAGRARGRPGRHRRGQHRRHRRRAAPRAFAAAAAGIPVVEHLTGLGQLPPAPGSPPCRCASRDSAPSRSGRSPGARVTGPAGPGRSV